MTSDRPYRKAMPEDVALDELRRNAGAQFDPGSSTRSSTPGRTSTAASSPPASTRAGARALVN